MRQWLRWSCGIVLVHSSEHLDWRSVVYCCQRLQCRYLHQHEWRRPCRRQLHRLHRYHGRHRMQPPVQSGVLHHRNGFCHMPCKRKLAGWMRARPLRWMQQQQRTRLLCSLHPSHLHRRHYNSLLDEALRSWVMHIPTQPTLVSFFLFSRLFVFSPTSTVHEADAKGKVPNSTRRREKTKYKLAASAAGSSSTKRTPRLHDFSMSLSYNKCPVTLTLSALSLLTNGMKS